MIDQLKKLEHRRDTSRLCLLFKILHHQVHVSTYDIPAPAPITATISSHERNLSVPYARTDACMCTNIHSSHAHTVLLWNKLPEMIKKTQSLDTFKSGIYNFILNINYISYD